MKAVILAGGQGKRLGDLTLKLSKCLLPIAGRPIIEYIIEKIEDVKEIDSVYILTIPRFQEQFEESLGNISHVKTIKVRIPEPWPNPNGAIGALNEFIVNENIREDILIVAGDNLFDFCLTDFIEFFNERKRSPIIACFDMKDKKKVKEKYGVVKLNNEKRITCFKEKPKRPPSSLASTACYLFPGPVLHLVCHYLAEGNNADAPGFFVSWLYKKCATYGFEFSKWWFDIGDIESYNRADLFFKELVPYRPKAG